ncbi:MAG: FapA family protein [Treponema sp.]|nr:FapA family protein [Treponema sp.]
MVTLDVIRKDMASQLKTDQELQNVEVQADTLDEALADAAVQLECHVNNLEYEVLERGFEGFLGLAKKPWRIRAYQNADAVAKIAKDMAAGILSEEELAEQEQSNDRNGAFYIHRFGSDVMLKVTLPVGEGVPVRAEDIISQARRPDNKSLDENRIKQLAETGTNDEYEIIGEYEHNPAGDAIFVVEIAKDEMTATVTISPPIQGGADVSRDMIIKALKSQGVNSDFAEEKIALAVDAPIYNEPMVVAEAPAAIDGKDAYMVYEKETDRSKLRAKITDSGQVDFKELNNIQNVFEGEPLAHKVPAEKGRNGHTLFGVFLEAKDGKDIPLPLGKNVTVDKDGLTILAATNGQFLFANDKVSVEPVMEVEGVNIKTGNITFNGKVVCKGNVEDGFNIKASGDIEISGAVGRCHIESDGNIIVSQGIMGRDEGEIICGKTLWAKFIQNTKVSVGENVIVNDSIMNSDVTAMKKIVLQGKRAQITGGHLFATEIIAAKNIGSTGGGTETVLEVGYDPKAKQRLLELQDNQSSNVKELDELELNISALESMKKARRTLPKDKEENLANSIKRRDEILNENDDINDEIAKIQARLRELKVVGKVMVSGTVYAGVKVYVRDEKDEVIADTKSVTFFYEDGFVRRGKYEEPDLTGIQGPDGYSSN